mmetsp:Transcript_34581/g.81999  ORF Transcript_34581/g.81999 Transcript_34581/m.81999 type:complete len:231 (-) Transcript_34581:456-1148(-)
MLAGSSTRRSTGVENSAVAGLCLMPSGVPGWSSLSEATRLQRMWWNMVLVVLCEFWLSKRSVSSLAASSLHGAWGSCFGGTGHLTASTAAGTMGENFCRTKKSICTSRGDGGLITATLASLTVKRSSPVTGCSCSKPMSTKGNSWLAAGSQLISVSTSIPTDSWPPSRTCGAKHLIRCGSVVHHAPLPSLAWSTNGLRPSGIKSGLKPGCWAASVLRKIGRVCISAAGSV